METRMTGRLAEQVYQKLKSTCAGHSQVSFEAFVNAYLSHLSEEELEMRHLDFIAQVVKTQWEEFHLRKTHEAKLRILNLQPTDFGVPSLHTLILITLEDKPFLLRSLILAMNRLGIHIHMLLHTGSLAVQRSSDGMLESLAVTHQDRKSRTNAINETAICIEIDRHLEEGQTLQEILTTLRQTIEDVSAVVKDFPRMMTSMQHSLAVVQQHPSPHLQQDPKGAPASGEGLPIEAKEAQAFLEWLMEGHFIFMGAAEYDVKHQGHATQFVLRPNSTLGVMNNPAFLKDGVFLEDMPNAQVLSTTTSPIHISKTSVRSTVNRGSHCECISVRQFDQDRLVSETRYVGLFTSAAYHESPDRIPVLRQKIAQVIELSGFGMDSHDGKALMHILETFPRDELYSISTQELMRISMGVLQLQERQRTRSFMYHDPFQRYVLVMVYLPRDVYHSDVALRMQSLLQESYRAVAVAYKPNFTKSVLCRIDFVLTLDPNTVQTLPLDKDIEKKLIMIARDWREDLRDVLFQSRSETEALNLYQRYVRAFPSAYREMYSVETAVHDIDLIEKALTTGQLHMQFYRHDHEGADKVHFKLFQQDHPIALTDVLPILENMGMRVIGEHPYEITLDTGKVWLSDFSMQLRSSRVAIDDIKQRFQETFAKTCLGEVEDDGFNQLVSRVGLHWREIVLLRAIARYLIQIGFHYSQQQMADTFAEYPEITRALVEYFMLKFDPHLQVSPEERAQQIALRLSEVDTKLSDVAHLEQDRVIRRFTDVLKAMIRTNFFQRDSEGQLKSYVSFKVMSKKIPDMPKPVPLVEVFIYSPRVEGIHLRGAKVARGGIRWSDRLSDFRTEVLGLVKAQQVKNAVIVPLGAKGGFYPKRLPVGGSRDAVLQEGIASYQIFIRGLLDITDNYLNGQIVPPREVMRYDEDDPYLVVAADKGTATFSDYANQMSKEYGFWLGDAFASGGSNGYDHKKMAITARGAWESVKRHFLELGVDIQSEDFTVVGIGDMAGDVFGNGMLRSPHIRLLGAFNHMHIFVDPNPDASISFAERERLFNLPRSSWKDYAPELISQGGGVFERSAKKIPVSPEMKACFGIEEESVEPNQLIQALLKAQVDLLWNGGIGTYVKASFENHMDVGDRTNDAVRVSANQLRAKVIGEGGNLGFTQQARVEFALNGGMICTDAIDNSAGVDCSDHEVNIKILLNEAIRRGDLKTEDRNQLLADMRDEVGRLVLHNNYHQTQTISHVLTYGTQALEVYIQLIKELESTGQLDREMEFIPSNKVLRARRVAGQGLTAPEFSVLMAYTKTAIKRQLLESSLPDEPYFVKYLEAEFPKILSERYSEAMKAHGLRREIVVTQLTNDLVTFMGLTFFHRMQNETGASAGRLCKALVVAWELLELPAMWKEIESLDGQVPPAVQRSLMDDVARLARRCCRWILRHYATDFNVDELIIDLKPTITHMMAHENDFVDSQSKQQRRQSAQYYYRKGVPKGLADRVVNYTVLSPLMDIVAFAKQSQTDPIQFAQLYYQCNDDLGLYWLRNSLSKTRDDGDSWSLLLGSTLRDGLDSQQARIVLGILPLDAKKSGHSKTADAESISSSAKSSHSKTAHIESISHSAKSRVNHWHEVYRPLVQRWLSLLNDLQSSEPDYVRFSVMIKTLEDMATVILKGHQ